MSDSRTAFFNDDADYMVSSLAAEWRAVATGNMLCRLGDFTPSLITHMAFHSGGRLWALGFVCVASFAKWLSDCLPRLVCFKQCAAVVTLFISCAY